MLEALGKWMGFPAYFTAYGGDQPPRTGASHAAIAPYGPFQTGDGKVVFLGIQNEREWARFCEEVLERPEMAEDERFDTNSGRVENVEELREAIEGAFEKLSADEAIERLEAAKIANARIRTMQEFIEHPQLKARDRWREVGSPAGPLRVLLPPVTMREVESDMKPIPEVGEHTDAILNELGLDYGRISDLRESGAI
jgi:crotonobetainyl-CoA:carnitine CoA-transferase CaiB-like acyl-CoA transferase